MDAHEIVVHEVDRKRRHVVLDFLGEAIRQASEPTHGHPHREVRAFDVAGRDVSRIGIAHDRYGAGTDALRGAVALLFRAIRPVHLDEHGVVDLRPEAILHGIQIGLVAVCGQLDAMAETAREVLDEFCSGSAVARADYPARDQFRIGIDGRPGPHAADAELAFLLLWNVLVLRPDERPDLIALNPAAGEIAEHAVLILGADRASLYKELCDGVLGHAGNADSSADAVSVYEAPNHLSAGFGT